MTRIGGFSGRLLSAVVKSHFVSAEFVVVAFVVGLGICLSPLPASAHDQRVHAMLVTEAYDYIARTPEYGDLRRYLELAGVNEAQLKPDSPMRSFRDDCWHYSFVKGPDGLMRFDPLAYEACFTDFYQDMYFDFLGADLLSYVAATKDAAIEIIDDLIKDLEGSAQWWCLLPGGWEVCATEVFRAFLEGCIDQNILAFRVVTSAGIEIVIDAATGSIVECHVGDYYFTSFSHHTNVTRCSWAGEENDCQGYEGTQDPSLNESILDANVISEEWYDELRRHLGMEAGKALGACVHYGRSDALHQYHVNGSMLDEGDFKHRFIYNTEFEPSDNMATYGFNQAANRNDLVDLGRALHVAGDASVPYHVTGQGAGGHGRYEKYVFNHWEGKRDAWMSDDRIAYYLTVFTPTLEPDELITNASSLCLSIPDNYNTVDEFSDKVVRDRLCMSVAAIVTLLEKTRTTIGAKVTEVPLSNITTYPLPESRHPSGNGMDDQFEWKVASPNGSACGKIKLTFSQHTALPQGSKLRISYSASVAGGTYLPVGTYELADLAGKTLEVSQAGSLHLQYDLSNAGSNSDWGFRVVNVDCEP